MLETAESQNYVQKLSTILSTHRNFKQIPTYTERSFNFLEIKYAKE